MRILIALVVVIVFSVIGTFKYLDSTMCENTEIEISVSPDKKQYAVLFERNCGATTGYSSQISILNINEKLNNSDTGNIYIANGYPENYSIKWVSPYVLHINGAREKTFKKIELHNSVTIYYE